MILSEKRKPSPDQAEAIRSASGPCQIIAGPGSGKTYVLVEHTTYLIESLHISPSSILVLTFSKAAALEMQERFQKRTGSLYPDVTFGTFHSVFYHILRLSLAKPIHVADQASRTACLKLCLDEYFAGDQIKPPLESLVSEISRYKSAAGRRYSVSHSFPYPDEFQMILRDYTKFLKENDLVDYDDMITECHRLLRSDRGILHTWQKRFSHILVDEFQDINPGQYSVIRLLAEGSRNIYAVGDDDQSIYAFRGSNPACMKWLQRDFQGCRTIYLTLNFRCGKSIVKAAGKVIGENRLRLPKKIRSGLDLEGTFSIQGYETAESQYDEIARRILDMEAGERQSCAVIFRSHTQLKAFGRILARVRGDGSLLDQDPLYHMILEDLTAYYRLALQLRKGGGDRADLFRIMNRPMRYLSRESFPNEKITLRSLNNRADSRMARFLEDLRILGTVRPRIGIRYLFDTMEYRSWVLSTCQEKDRDRLRAAFGQAEKLLTPYKDSEEVLECLSGAVQTRPGDRSEEDPEVSLLTMHASKGLEFDTVFIPDLNEGIMPARRCVTQEMIEEERRLLYVAMTRARKSLFMSYSRGTAMHPDRPSRFLMPFGIKPEQTL